MNAKNHVAHRSYTVESALALSNSPVDIAGKPIDKSLFTDEQGAFAWNGNVTMGEARDLVRKGWNERPNLSTFAEKILASGETCSHVETENSVAGAFPDIGAYLTGNPESMVQFMEKPAPRILTVAFDIAALSNITPMQMFRRGAIAVATVETLTRAGYGVKLVAVAAKTGYSKSTQKSISYSVTIKESTSLLDMDSLTFWACHPASQRRIMFSIQEHEPKGIRNEFKFQSGGGFGFSCPFIPEVAGLEVDLLINPRLEDDCYSDESASRYFEKLMAGFKA
jgi:hypothetical protein